MKTTLTLTYETRTPSGEDTLAIASTAFTTDVATPLATIISGLAADTNVDVDSITLAQTVATDAGQAVT